MSVVDFNLDLRFFPWSEILQWNSHHQLEIKARSTDQSIDLDVLASLLDFWKKLIDNSSNSFQTFGCSFVSGVLASDLTADAVERHGTVGERDRVGIQGGG